MDSWLLDLLRREKTVFIYTKFCKFQSLRTTKKSLVCQSPSTLCSPHSPPRATLAYDMELASTQVFNDVEPSTANAGNLSCWDIPETQCFDAAGPGSDAATQCGVDETQVVDADDLGWNAATQSGVDVKRVVDSAGTEFEGATQSGVEEDAGCPELECDAATQSGVEEKHDLDLPKLDTNLNSPSCEQDERASLGENCNSDASSPILSDVSKIVGEDQNFSTTSFQKPSVINNYTHNLFHKQKIRVKSIAELPLFLYFLYIPIFFSFLYFPIFLKNYQFYAFYVAKSSCLISCESCFISQIS